MVTLDVALHLSGPLLPHLKNEDGDPDSEADVHCMRTHIHDTCVLRTYYKPGTGHQWLPGQTQPVFIELPLHTGHTADK